MEGLEPLACAEGADCQHLCPVLCQVTSRWWPEISVEMPQAVCADTRQPTPLHVGWGLWPILDCWSLLPPPQGWGWTVCLFTASRRDIRAGGPASDQVSSEQKQVPWAPFSKIEFDTQPKQSQF